MKKIWNFLTGYRNEIVRTRWDTKEQIVKNFYITLSILAFFAFVFFSFDLLISQLFNLLGVTT